MANCLLDKKKRKHNFKIQLVLVENNMKRSTPPNMLILTLSTDVLDHMD